MEFIKLKINSLITLACPTILILIMEFIIIKKIIIGF